MLRGLAAYVLVLTMLCISSARAVADNFYGATANQLALPPGTLLRHEPVKLPALFRATAYRILYVSRDFANRPIAASGIVVVSTVHKAAGRPQHIVAWAHPTVGTAQGCAPSLRQEPTRYICGLKDLVAAGHVVVATDYPGLGTPGPVGFLVGKGQARAVLDSVRAAAQLPGVDFLPDYAVYGFSQGGHAALFAAREAPTYMPEFRLKGVAAIAPPTDLAQLFAADAGTIEGKVLLSYTMKSWSAKYGLNLREVISTAALPVVSAINATCVDDFAGALAVFAEQKKFGSAIFTASPLAHPGWRKYLAENSVSALTSGVPYMIVQGGQDSIVRPAVTMAALRASCRAGVTLKLVYLKDKGHGGANDAAFPEVSNWLSSVLGGKAPQNSCK